MTAIVRRVALWAIVGPLIGAVLASPMLWYLGSPFDRSWHSVDTFLFGFASAYLIGIPPALLTGAVTAVVESQVSGMIQRRFISIATGALSSTYLFWLVIWDETSKDISVRSWLPLFIFLVSIGAISTCGVLELAYRRLKADR
jgi:hypothetical protein